MNEKNEKCMIIHHPPVEYLYYMEDGEVKKTHIDDKENFIKWATFIYPPLQTSKRYKEELRTNSFIRQEFVKTSRDALSVFTMLFKKAGEKNYKPITYDGKLN